MLCGRPAPAAIVEQQASIALAVDEADGPILGERIEYHGDAAERDLDAATVDAPCEWDERGVRWRLSEDEPPPAGEGGRVYIVESLTGPKGYTYEVATRIGPELVRFSLNVREPDRELLDVLVERGVEKAARSA
jgi:hypothetical protein